MLRRQIGQVAARMRANPENRVRRFEDQAHKIVSAFVGPWFTASDEFIGIMRFRQGRAL
jgi:hypothetical protein